MSPKVGKEELISTLRERLQWLVYEADEKEYNEEEVSAIVDTLSALDPIELPGNYFTPEEAFKRFWRNQERTRQQEARRSGEFYISRLEENGFWEDSRVNDFEAKPNQSGSEDTERSKNKEVGDGIVGMGSRDAGTKKETSAEEANQNDDPTNLFYKIKSEYVKQKLDKHEENLSEAVSCSAKEVSALNEEQAPDSGNTGVGEAAFNAAAGASDVTDILRHITLLEKSGVDLEQIKELLQEEEKKRKQISEEEYKRMCRRKKWKKGTIRVAVAVMAVVAIGLGGTIGVYAEKEGFFHWRKNDEEKLNAVVSVVEHTTNAVEYLSYDKLEDVSIKYLSYLWVPNELPEEFRLQGIYINNNSMRVKTEMTYLLNEAKFLVFIRNEYLNVITYTDRIFDGFQELETKTYSNGFVVKFLKKENDDYTEYMAQFDSSGSLYCVNSNLPYDDFCRVVDMNIKPFL